MPEWGERLLDKIDADKQKPKRDRPAVGLKFPNEWVAPIQAAAQARNMTMAAYARRALMAFVCADLGLDWDEVMKNEPKFHPYNQDGPAEFKAGTGHGKWQIESLR